MLRHDRVPIWLTRSRLRFLLRFRSDLETYFGQVTYEAFPFRVVETEQAVALRADLESRLRRCRRVIAATGRVSLKRLAPGERQGEVERVNLIDATFELGRYNLGKGDVLGAIQLAEAAYREDLPAAWLRTVNPLYWLDLLLNYVEQVPFLPLRLFGVRASRAAATGPGRVVRVVVRLAALTGLAFFILQSADLQDDALAWIKGAFEGLRR